jgi:hypothetical protein
VDDYPNTSSADALTHGTTAGNITFGFSAFDVPSGATGISVQVRYVDGEASNGANNCGGRLKVGGSYFNATTHNPSGTGGTAREDNWATNPKTSAAWTVDDVNGVGVNALQAFGIVSTDANPTLFIASAEVQVTYTPPAAELSSTVTLDAVTSAGTIVATSNLDSAVTLGDVTSAGTITVEGGGSGVELTSAVTLGDVTSAGQIYVGSSLVSAVTLDDVTSAGEITVQTTVQLVSAVSLEDVTCSGEISVTTPPPPPAPTWTPTPSGILRTSYGGRRR